MKHSIHLFAALTAAGFSTLVCAAEDDTKVPEVIVTAQFRDDDVNRVPSSVSVVTDAEIRRNSAKHLEDILGATPNVNFSKGSSRARFLQIRGIGERSQFIEPLNSSVGLVIDGVDFSGIGTMGTLFDVAQVEVLRGPQGTLYGANALAGLVNVVTHAPTDEPHASVHLETGGYGLLTVGGVVSGALSDNARGRLAVQSHEVDGFIHNANLLRNDTDNRDELTLRGKLEFDLSDSTVLNIAAGWVDIDNGYDAFSLDNNRTTYSDQPGKDIQETAYVSAELVWSAAPSYDIEAHVGFAQSDIDYWYDEDWTFVGFHPWEYRSTDRYVRNRDTVTGEIRFVSKDGGRWFDDTTDWTAGLYVLDQSVDLLREYTFADGDLTSDFSINRVAVFGQTETALNDDATLTVGLRLERHSSDYADSEGVRFEPSDTMVGGRIALDYRLSDSVIGYVSASRGYKAGGFNTDGTLDADLREFDPEKLDNYEVGLKSLLADDTVALRVSLFHMSRRDVQIASSLVRVREGVGPEFIAYTDNAAEGTNFGVEAEVTVVANEYLELFGSVGLLDTEYEDFINANGEDLNGREQAHAPGYQYSAGFEISHPLGLFARAGVEARDEFFFSDSHDQRSDSYALVNASIGIERASWSITAWGRNLTDDDYFVRGFFFGNDPRDFYTARPFTQLGEPRRYGVTVNYAIR